MQQITIKVGAKLFQWDSRQVWVNHASRNFRDAGVRGGDVICVASDGRVCNLGIDFRLAEEEVAYPVTVYRVREE